MSVRASRRLMILLPHPAQCIRLYARTRTPTDACSISAVATMPIWSDLSLLILNRYSTSFGVSLIGQNLHGSTSGESAISSCGIIAAPCTDAMRSTRIRAASCTAPKSRASNDQRKRVARGARMSSHGTAETNGDIPMWGHELGVLLQRTALNRSKTLIYLVP